MVETKTKTAVLTLCAKRVAHMARQWERIQSRRIEEGINLLGKVSSQHSY